MGKGKKHRLRSRTLRSYIISYTSVVLIALAMLSIMAAWQLAIRMRNETIRVTEARMYTIIEDLDSQFAEMRVTAVELASLEEFSLDYFQENKYREVELLERLKKYYSRNSISNYFFLKYMGYDNIFTSGGTTMPLQVHLRQYLNENDCEQAVALIGEMCTGPEKAFFLLKKEGAPALFIYPLEMYAMAGGGRGVLCMEVPESSLEKRMEKIAGRMEGDITLYYDGIRIYGEETSGGDFLERQSDDGRIRAVFYPAAESWFSWGNVFAVREWLVLLAIALALLCVAVLAAWRSYRPILEIVKKYELAAEDSMEWELDNIDMLIDGLLRKDEKNSRLLQEQYQALREQTIRLISRGGFTKGIQERLPMLNLHLDTASFCRIRCFLEIPEGTEEWKEPLRRDAEELSDDGVWLYPFWGESGLLNVLAAVSEEYQADEAVEALRALFEARDINARVGREEICHDLRLINSDERQLHSGREDREGNNSAATEADEREGREPGSCGDVQSGQEEEKRRILPGMQEGEKDAGLPPGKKKSTALRAVRYIEENCTKYDLSLDLVAQEFHITSTYLCRLIKQQTGESYKEYLTGLRVAAAKEMLQEENASVADVCQRTGYTNVSHFIKVFQKAEGITPARYRDEFQKGTGLSGHSRI